MPSLLKAEIFTSVKKPESGSLNAYIYNMLNFFKSVTFFEKNKIFFCSPGYTKPSVQSTTTCGGYAGFQPHHQPCRKFLAAKHEENLSIRVSATPIFPAIRQHTLVQDGCYRSCSAGFISYLSNMQDFLFFVMFFTIFFIFFTQKNIRAKRGD